LRGKITIFPFYKKGKAERGAKEWLKE